MSRVGRTWARVRMRVRVRAGHRLPVYETGSLGLRKEFFGCEFGLACPPNSDLDFNENIKDTVRNYRRHEKPPYSYITLIAMAIKAQKDEQATLQQINDWLIQNFLFFRGEYIGWKNSVRHNLSLNDCFVKVISSILSNASDSNRRFGHGFIYALGQ